MGTQTTKSTPKKAGGGGAAAWREKFLACLASYPNVTAACRCARVDRKIAYLLRHSDPKFAAQWAEALQLGIAAAEDEAWRRAKGSKASDTLIIFMLKAHRPEVYREPRDVNLTGDLSLRVTIPGLTDDADETADG